MTHRPSLAAKLGSRKRLKVRTRWGCSWCASQMRCTERSEMPTALEIAPPAQWVAGCRGVVQSLPPRRPGSASPPVRWFARQSGFCRAYESCRAIALQPNLGGALLPAPYCRSADTDARRHSLRRFPLGQAAGGIHDSEFHRLRRAGTTLPAPRRTSGATSKRYDRAKSRDLITPPIRRASEPSPRREDVLVHMEKVVWIVLCFDLFESAVILAVCRRDRVAGLVVIQVIYACCR